MTPPRRAGSQGADRNEMGEIELPGMNIMRITDEFCESSEFRKRTESKRGNQGGNNAANKDANQMPLKIKAYARYANDMYIRFRRVRQSVGKTGRRRSAR